MHCEAGHSGGSPRSVPAHQLHLQPHLTPGRAGEAGKGRGLSRVLRPQPHLWPHEKGAGVSDLIPSWGQPGWFSASQRPLCSGQTWTRDASGPRSGPCCITRDPKQPLLGLCVSRSLQGTRTLPSTRLLLWQTFITGLRCARQRGPGANRSLRSCPVRPTAPPGPCPNQLQCRSGLWGCAQCTGG